MNKDHEFPNNVIFLSVIKENVVSSLLGPNTLNSSSSDTVSITIKEKTQNYELFQFKAEDAD